MVLPSGVGEAVGWIKDGDRAALVAIAPPIAAGRDGEWRGGGSDGLAVLEEGALVVFDLDDQRDVSFGCDLEMFF
jgi:hypothetical protein